MCEMCEMCTFFRLPKPDDHLQHEQPKLDEEQEHQHTEEVDVLLQERYFPEGA